MTKVKICGLKRKEDIEFANILLPEYAGFVFAAQLKAGFGRASCKTAGRIGFEGSDCRCFCKRRY